MDLRHMQLKTFLVIDTIHASTKNIAVFNKIVYHTSRARYATVIEWYVLE